MLVNSNITIYHKKLNKITKLEEWERHNYDSVWLFGGKGASLNKGYADANDIDIRIFYKNNDININNFAIGDIIVGEKLVIDIKTQKDLSNYQIYNIKTINNNNFGKNPHLHLGGK